MSWPLEKVAVLDVPLQSWKWVTTVFVIRLACAWRKRFAIRRRQGRYHAGIIVALLWAICKWSFKIHFGDTLIPFELVIVSVSCEYDEAEDATTAGDLPTHLSPDTLVAASAGNQYPHKRQRVAARSDGGSETPTRQTDNDFSVFVPVNSTGRRLVRCSVCFEHQEVATMFANKKHQLPSIC